MKVTLHSPFLLFRSLKLASNMRHGEKVSPHGGQPTNILYIIVHITCTVCTIVTCTKKCAQYVNNACESIQSTD